MLYDEENNEQESHLRKNVNFLTQIVKKEEISAAD
jgi:hypothetical protein